MNIKKRFNRNKLFSISLFLILLGMPQLLLANTTSKNGGTAALAVTPQPTPPLDDDILPVKPPLTQGEPAASVPTVPKRELPSDSTAAVAATVTVWYENEWHFGERGNPQEWVNILGNVSGGSIDLDYRLNGGGGWKDIETGADSRRLAEAGDFNIELDFTSLISGTNTVDIRESDTYPILKTIQFNYQAGNSWPQSYEADWSTAVNIHDVAQVVDGQWSIVNNKLRPYDVATGSVPVLDYDRLVAIGDVTWTDYQVTVPVTIHGIDEGGYSSPSNGPGVGMILRWNGHYQAASEQPRIGWEKLGALGWYRWGGTVENQTTGLQLIGYSFGDQYPGGGNILYEDGDVQLNTDEEYIYKMNVRTIDGVDAIYRMKVWRSDLPEPAAWDMVGTLDDVDDAGHPVSGSMLLVAHHVDASFGNVTIEPLSQVRQMVTVDSTGNGSVAVTDPVGQTDYEFGSDVTLTAVPDFGYMFNGWTGDCVINAGLGALEENRCGNNPLVLPMDSDKSVTATFAPVAPPLSDDFNSCTANSIWTTTDPVGDGTVVFNGTQLMLSIPGGTEHDLWTDVKDVLRVMQPADNEDFEVEVKFESAVTINNQMQGILIEQDAGNFIRFDFLYASGVPKVFAATFVGGSATQEINQSITPTSSDWYLRVTRTGNLWTMAYSFNGTNWTTADSFTHPLSVTSVGVFVGNAEDPPNDAPAHTAVVDYFFNTGIPLVDDDYGFMTNTIGQGQISIVSPAEPQCGDQVTLEAVPDSGWQFTDWSGATPTTEDQAIVTYDANTAVTATFKEEFTLTINIVGMGTVTPPDQGVYLDGEEVTLTAVPDSGYTFSGWSGAVTGGNETAVVTMTSNQTVTATFIEGDYQLFLPIIINSP